VKIVFFQPQIPQNTGNVVRTCSVTGTALVLVRPFGFSTASRHLKRAGLDYWEGVDVEMIDDLPSWLSIQTDPFYFFSSKTKKSYLDVPYEPNHILIFGSETAGLPPILWERYPEKFISIPMLPEKRCLNLATSAGIALYSALASSKSGPFSK
jgi:tRNA (cytidine/uridine-2'-O-)-methyltransferase